MPRSVALADVNDDGKLDIVTANYTTLSVVLGNGKGGFSLFDLADFCAKVNFDAFDATGYYFPGYEKDGLGVPTDKYIFDLKRHAFDLGLAISGTGVGNNFTVADKAARLKRFVAVPLAQRYQPFAVRARQLLAEGRFGPVSHIYVRLNRPAPARYPAWDSAW